MSAIVIDEKVIVLDHVEKVTLEGNTVYFYFSKTHISFYNENEDQAKALFNSVAFSLEKVTDIQFLFFANVIIPAPSVQFIEREGNSIRVFLKSSQDHYIYFDSEEETKKVMSNILSGYGHTKPTEIEFDKQ